MQSWNVSSSATYKFEVWEEQGGISHTESGRYSGYSYGNISLTEGQTFIL